MVSRTALGYIVSIFVFFLLDLYPITTAFAQQGRYDGWGEIDKAQFEAMKRDLADESYR